MLKYDNFQDILFHNLGIKASEKILVAVSGGIDSMVLLHLMQNVDCKIGAAHCNFQLRDTESDGDESFVRSYCEQNQIPIFIKQFKTIEAAESTGISIQMAARNLRYEWFAETASIKGFDYIAIAHNKNDVAETFFLNLARGTGIQGLAGMAASRNNIIRPLLNFSRDEIEHYALDHHIGFREDSSNASDKYARNFIRHHIVPAFEKLNPSFLESISSTMEHLSQVTEIYHGYIDDNKRNIISITDDRIHISIEALKKLYGFESILFGIIHQYGFTRGQVHDIIKVLNAQSGKQFYTSSYQLVKDREHLIITKIENSAEEEYLIPKASSKIDFPLCLTFENFDIAGSFTLLKQNHVAELDASLLEFPLKLRRWKAGDYFYPFGMKGKKKLSDFFTDLKISLPEKKDIWLLLSGKDIVWVVGKRIDDRYKVKNDSKRMLRISIA